MWGVYWLPNHEHSVTARSPDLTDSMIVFTTDRATIYEQKYSAPYQSNSGTRAVSEDKVRPIGGFRFLDAVC